jgi:hypothetical protein
LAVVGFFGAACLLEECLTTKNNPKDNGYLIKCFALIFENSHWSYIICLRRWVSCI